MKPLARTARSCALVSTLLLVVSPALAHEVVLSPAGGDTSDNFGGGGWLFTVTGGPGVAMSGDVLVGGSLGDDLPGEGNQGSATVFHRTGTTWSEGQTLTSSGGDKNDLFGYAVDVCGPVIVVGSPWDDVAGVSEQGSATVFRWNGSNWDEEQILVATGGESGDQFGVSVSVSGDVIVVGAVEDDVGGNISQGSATVFRFNGSTWDEEQTLLASGGEAFDNFGTSVCVSGNSVVVGALFDDVGGNVDAGSATVYRWNGVAWVEEQELSPVGSATSDSFGAAVSVSGDLLVASSVFAQVGGIAGAGSATVFRWDGASWVEEQTLSASAGGAYDFFGSSVEVNGLSILVGAVRDDVGGTVDQGSATLFRWDGATWIEQPLLTSNVGAYLDAFGAGVALYGDYVAVAAPGHDVGGNGSQGAVSVFDLPAQPWSDQGSALAGIFGEPLLVGAGDLVAAGSNRINLSRVAPNAIAALLVANSGASIPFKGGFLRPFPFALSPALFITSPTGTVSLPFVMPGGIAPATELWFQWAIRDLAAIHDVSLSNAVLGVTP